MKYKQIIFENNFINNYKDYNLFQDDNLYKSSEDALYLTEFIKNYLNNKTIPDNFSILDIGAGNGVIDILLYDTFLKFLPGTLKMYCVELQKELYELSQINFKKYNMSEIVKLYNADILNFANNNSIEFDLIYSNPPYYPPDKFLVSPNKSIANAKFEISLNLFDLLKTSKSLLKKNGCLIIINIEYNYSRIINYAKKLNYKKVDFFKITDLKNNNYLISILYLNLTI